VERARQEGIVVLYTSLAPTESKPLADAFEKKYGVKVELWRALSDKVVQRVVTEAQGNRHTVDVVETNGPEMEAIAQEKLLAEVYSPYLADLPADGIPPHRTWFPDRLNFFVVGYNTQKVQRSEIPATYEGFLDPKWQGRIGIEATDAEWMATLVKLWGDEGVQYFRKLSAMKPEDERFTAKTTVLIENVEHHMGEEEQDWFPQVRAGLGRKQLQELGAEMVAARSKAPRRPSQPGAVKKVVKAVTG